MIEQLKEIDQVTSGEVVIVGGYAKWLNGYTDQPSKIWVDIVIPPGQKENIKTLGKYIEYSNSIFPPTSLPTTEQFIVKSNNYILDVFVQDISIVEYTEIQGLKVITPQQDVDYHTQLAESLPNESTQSKLNSLKALYSL